MRLPAFLRKKGARPKIRPEQAFELARTIADRYRAEVAKIESEEIPDGDEGLDYRYERYIEIAGELEAEFGHRIEVPPIMIPRDEWAGRIVEIAGPDAPIKTVVERAVQLHRYGLFILVGLPCEECSDAHLVWRWVEPESGLIAAPCEGGDDAERALCDLAVSVPHADFARQLAKRRAQGFGLPAWVAGGKH